MSFSLWLRRFSCRRCLSIVLISYLLMTLVFIINLDVKKMRSETEEESFSLIFPEPTILAGRQSSSQDGSSHSSHSRLQNRELVDNLVEESPGKRNDFPTLSKPQHTAHFRDPTPLSAPMIDIEIRAGDYGDFVAIGKETYVYSAFLDDRKEERFIRIMTLMSKKTSTLSIHCHFNDTWGGEPQKAEQYQLCENHNKYYGGYIFSCRVPDALTSSNITTVEISFTKYGVKTTLPVMNVRPPEHKLAFLDSYPRSSYLTAYDKQRTNLTKVPLTAINFLKFSTDNLKPKKPSLSPHYPLSFAICVSPLFGNISVHRLVEFIELSLLLGAEHFYFYNHSSTRQISETLEYYIDRKIATVLPWRIPSDINPTVEIWYHGQLLANNDCMYRSMSRFDLVSFNDLDEFIVPHTNATSWKEVLPSMLTQDRCGFFFQSAFYDPGTRESAESRLLTPVLTAKSKEYSKVRTKVMLCPWRVFEVGIHHISKQNREDWRPWGVEPSLAYLHHYRRCIANYGMRCSSWVKDTIIADRYLKNMTTNFEAALQQILGSE